MNDTWTVCEEHHEARPWGCTWVINAPWAHPFWSQYLLMLYDLTSPTEKPPVIHMEGATHEFLLFAVDPDHPLMPHRAPSEQTIRTLEPPNMGYQFRAADNDAARVRIGHLVEMVKARVLSPDTDFRSKWNNLMSDAHPMVRSRLGDLLRPQRKDH